MKPKILAVVIYICAAGAVFYSFMGGFRASETSLAFLPALLLISLAAASIIMYGRLVCHPESGEGQRVLALVVNCGGAGILATYLLLAPITAPPVYENPSVLYRALLVAVPLFVVFASHLIIARRRLTRAIATIATLLAWSFFVFIAVVPAYFPAHFGFVSARYAWLAFAAITAPCIFVFAAVAVSYFPRLGYIMGAVAGTPATPLFVSQEFARFRMMNSWIALNTSEPKAYIGNLVLFGQLRILAVALIVVAVMLSVLRLLPATWALRKRPVRDRTWPAFAVCLLILTMWFCSAATPYRMPDIVDAVPPELAVLHVEKRGLQFHETAVTVYRDSRLYISRNNRKLFQYQFEESVANGVLPETMSQRVFSLAKSLQLADLHTPPVEALRAWNAEGWYIRIPHSGPLAFTSEYGTAPPNEVVELFDAMEVAVPTDRGPRRLMKDVCLGFCYDPLAGLGLLYSNQRCRADEKGATRCR